MILFFEASVEFGLSKSLIVMQFLIRSNESFAAVRGQILLMDPMPPINKVFSLIRQEERQRSLALLMVH